jgi:hypothetical protein
VRRLALASLLLLTAAACHVVRYDTGRPASQRVVAIPVNFFVWGLIGDHVVDLDAACPEGAARWQNRATPVNALIDFVTLGIWSPRTVTIECAEGRER